MYLGFVSGIIKIYSRIKFRFRPRNDTAHIINKINKIFKFKK